MNSQKRTETNTGEVFSPPPNVGLMLDITYQHLEQCPLHRKQQMLTLQLLLWFLWSFTLHSEPNTAGPGGSVQRSARGCVSQSCQQREGWQTTASHLDGVAVGGIK